MVPCVGDGVYPSTGGHMGKEKKKHGLTATYRTIPSRQAGEAAAGGGAELREEGERRYKVGRPPRPLQRASDRARST